MGVLVLVSYFVIAGNIAIVDDAKLQYNGGTIALYQTILSEHDDVEEFAGNLYITTHGSFQKSDCGLFSERQGDTRDVGLTCETNAGKLSSSMMFHDH